MEMDHMSRNQWVNEIAKINDQMNQAIRNPA
jgi:hypothetical protein